jgi:hypothetical protein
MFSLAPVLASDAQYSSLHAFYRLLELLKDFCQEILKAQGDVAVAIVVILLENVRHTFQGDTALNKEIEAHDSLIPLIIGIEEQLNKLGA